MTVTYHFPIWVPHPLMQTLAELSDPQGGALIDLLRPGSLQVTGDCLGFVISQ